MDYFETEIAKYERRLAMIEQHPDPSMLESNKLLYSALLEHNREQLRWWREGRPFVAVSGNGMATLLRAFGDFRVLGLVQMADRMGAGHVDKSFERIRAMGLPDYACDRTILFLPLSMEGVEMPKPRVIVTRTGGCNVINDSHRTLAYLMDVPVHTVEVPFLDPHQEHLDYVARQLEILIEWIEANLPGAKYDESRLVEFQALDRRWYAALHDIYQLRKLVPCPDHPRDVFREPIQPADYAVPSMIVEYYEHYRDELKARAEKHWSGIGGEKARILWSISGPYGSGVWDYLARREVSVPFWHYGGAKRLFTMPIIGDTREFGRKLSPLEEVARTILYNSWGGDGDRWVKDTIAVCQEFQADGLVQFEQTGCKPIVGLARIIAERLGKEMGIPSWTVEGRMLLGHTERANAEFMAGLEAFVNLCLDRKRGR
ncbi:MAG: 2-hydroxyacyl-CoA dehydratase [Chloroflexi bacterium]|nr:2-hydroxyacyl-CoA dehydratase [Chloroflexota bacterium]